MNSNNFIICTEEKNMLSKIILAKFAQLSSAMNPFNYFVHQSLLNTIGKSKKLAMIFI